MAYPQYPIITAFIAALSTPALVDGSTTYDVFTAVQRDQDQYVLLSQPTLTSGSGSTDCETWDATVLLSVFTRFELNAAVNFDQTLAIGTEIAERLVKQRLPLDGFDMSPVELDLAETRQTANEGATYVQHTLRLRFEVYNGAAVATPTGKQLNDFTPTEILTYPRLSELGPLNCPAPQPVPDIVELRFRFTATSEDTFSLTLGENEVPTAFTEFSVSGGTARMQVDGTDVLGMTWVGAPSQTLLVTRLTGNPTAKAVCDFSLF